MLPTKKKIDEYRKKASEDLKRDFLGSPDDKKPELPKKKAYGQGGYGKR